MVDVEVEFKYDAEQPDELSIDIGDVIKNVVKSEGGWWEGELNGKKGMFPDNFVKVIKKEEKVEHREHKTAHAVQASKRQSVKDLANKIKDQVHEGPVPARKKDPNTRKKRAKVVYSYEPENEDEIKLDVGDSVEILKQEEEGWWEGVVNGKSGMFPSNFVEVFEDEGSNEGISEESKENDTNIIKGKKVIGVGLGNIFEGGQIKLRPAVGGGSNKKPVGSEREKKPDKPPEEPMVRKPRGGRKINMEEESLLPQHFAEKDACYPHPFIDNRDSYPQILVDDTTTADFEEKSDIQVEMSKSSLGTELLSQTESESETDDLGVNGVTDSDNEATNIEKDKIQDAEITETTNDSVLVKKHSNFYQHMPYIDSARVIMSQLSLGQESLVRMPSDSIMVNEDDLIEYEDVNIHPDFDESISLSTSNSDIDQNNQNTRRVQFRNHIQNSPENKNQNELFDMNHDLKCILDDLDTHLDQNQSLDSSSDNANKSNLESSSRFLTKYHNILENSVSSQTDFVDEMDSLSQNPLPVSCTSEAVDKNSTKIFPSKANDQMGWIGEHKTPQFEGEFRGAIDSIYVTKKRTGHNVEIDSTRTPEFTPHRPSSYFDQLRSGKENSDDRKIKATRKSVSFSPVNDTSVHTKPVKSLPKQGLSSLSPSSPKTYFASLEKSGHLSPFIKSIAQKYGLLSSLISSHDVPQVENLDTSDLDLDESYASTLLGKSGEFDASVNDNSLYENGAVAENTKQQPDDGSSPLDYSEETGGTKSEKVESMINSYLYDVFELESDKSYSSTENEITNNSVDQFVDRIISESCLAVEAELVSSVNQEKNSNRVNVPMPEISSSQSDCQDHDSELSDLEFHSDSVLLCITQGPDDDSPPLSSCSPSLYPLRIEPLLPEVSSSPWKKSESAVVTQNEKECNWFSRKPFRTREDEPCMFRPVERPLINGNFLMNNNIDDEDSILSYMMTNTPHNPKLPDSGHVCYMSHDSKLPHSGHVCQTSSYCRIPFGLSNAPPFWFKKDFKESPKQNKSSQHKIERKAKSPGKRSFTAFCESLPTEKLYQVPLLAKLAEKVHLSFFKKRLDAIGKRLNSEVTDKTLISHGCVERSPEKKRRRKQDMKTYQYRIDGNNSALSPVEEGSVEIYFTSLVDNAASKDSITGAIGVETAHPEPFKLQKESNNTSKVDWSKTLFGSKTEVGVQKNTEGTPYLTDHYDKELNLFVSDNLSPESYSSDSPFVSPFRSDRHFRQRPVQCVGPSSFVDDLAEKRKRRNFRSKVSVSKAAEPVTLTGFCRFSSRGSQDCCVTAKSRERAIPDTTPVMDTNDNRCSLGGFEQSSYLKIVCPGRFLLGTADTDEQNDELRSLLPIISKDISDCSIGSDSNVLRNYPHGNISTETNYSEGDLCASSDLSGLSFYEENLRQIGSDTAKADAIEYCRDDKQLHMHTNFVADNASSLSMFYKADELDESRSGISQSDILSCDKGPCNIPRSPDQVKIQLKDNVSKRQLADGSLNSNVAADSQCEKMVSDPADVIRKMETLEEAVKNHLDTSNDSEKDVLNIMKTRGTLYEVLSSVVESWSDALEQSNSAAVEACCNRVDNVENDSEDENKNDWEISPDPDTLLRDLEDIDLSDTPQYVNNKNTDEEMKQFLDDVLQPFDDIFVDSFNSMGESPIHRTSTKDAELYEGGPGLCEAASKDLTTSEDESVLNRSFIDEDQSADICGGTPIKIGLQNASSTPIADQFSPSKDSESPQENKLDDLIKFSDTEDESFVSATSSRPKHYDISKSTADSFESYETGIDRSSILGWTEDDTISANSELENFIKTLSESAAERTCFDQDESPNRIEEPLIHDWKFESDCVPSKDSYRGGDLAEFTESGAGDCLVDPDNIQLDLEEDSGRSPENHCDIGEGCDDNFFQYPFVSNNAHPGLLRTDEKTALSEKLHAVMPDLDGCSPEKVPSSGENDVSPVSKPACFYVGSSQESEDSS